MKDKNKTKKQLIEELSELRKRVTELEEAESERNNIEGKQKETEEQHKISTEFLSDGCLIVDLKGKVSDCNSAYLNHTGYSREDIVNKHFTKLPTLQKKDIPQYIKMFNSAIRGKFPKSMEYEWIHSDGTTRWGEAYFNIMRKKGRISGFNIITRDITERKRMEEHLRESEERYRAMFDQAPDSVVFIDGDTGAIVEYNERAYENLGYSREEFGRLKIPDYEALESAEEVSRHIKRIIRKGSDVFETKHRTKEGEIRDILVSSRAISFGGRDFVQSIWRDITEKKRLEEDLRESQQLLEKTFASLLDAVFIIDADTAEIMDCNLAASDIFGYSRQDMLGRTTAFLHVDQEALEEFRQHHLYPAVEDKGFLVLPEFRMKRKDGMVFPAEHSVMPLEDERGQRIGWVSVVRDITDRKRTEEALEKSEEKYRSLVESTTDSIYVVARDLRYMFMNKEYLSRLGLTMDEVIGKTYADFYSEEESEEFRKIVDKVLRTGKSLSHEHLSQRDGRYFFRTYSPIIKPDGKAEAVTIISKNISDIKDAEEKTRESEKRYRELVEKAEIGILIDDREGKIRYCNKILAQLFGYSIEEMKKRSIRSLIHPDDVDSVLKLHKYRMQGKESLSRYNYKGIKKDGSLIYIEVSAVALEEDGKIIGSRSYLWDITERREIEEEREKFIYNMGERIKELRCLYGVARSIRQRGTIQEIFNDVLDLIPPSWQYPEICRAKIRLNGDEYVSKLFEETKWNQKSDIIVNGKPVGAVEVYYLEERPTLHEGPFFKEERDLINGIARQLGEAIERIEAEKSLQKTQELYAGLADSITDVFFAVDHDLKYTFWNKASEKLTGIAAKDALGKSILDISPDDENIRKAIEFYKKVLTTKQSKTFMNKYQLGGKDFFFEISAYPSREGLSVFVKDITEHVQAEEAIRKHKNELQRLSSQLINAQEDERRRISHELHDEIGQSLTMMKLNLASIKDTLGPEQFSCIKKKWEDLNILTERLLEEAHQMTLDLRPHILDDLGLLSTLRWYVGSLSKKLDVDIKLKAANLEERLVPELEITLYRIVQEALTNIARHAQAKNVLLNIKRLKSSIKLKIEDDGKGFVLDEVDKPTQKEHGVGLFGMKERASLLNGKCIIESKPGEGTRVSVTLPLG